MRGSNWSLERYKGSRSRHACPSCGHKNEFARYVNDAGDYLDYSVGRCNRTDRCGYHRKPKEYFEAAGSVFSVQSLNTEQVNKNERLNTLNRLNTVNALNSFDTIELKFVSRSLEYAEDNRFARFLLSFLDADYVQAAVKRYFVGGTKDGRTCFWLIDKEGRARTGKIISYSEETGKRDKSKHPSWIHYELKRAKALPETFEHRLCFFGEHLLKKEKEKPVAIVEAEKTAVIASLFLDAYVWLAVGSKDYLNAEKLRSLGKRRIVLFPDTDGFQKWQEKASAASRLGLNVSVSRLLEDMATPEERAAKSDLADYLINLEIEAQKWNAEADCYNRKVDRILNDPELFAYFNEMVDERAAITGDMDLAESEENVIALVEYVTRYTGK